MASDERRRDAQHGSSAGRALPAGARPPAGVPQATISRIENAVVSPTVDTLEPLIRACGMELQIGERVGHGVDRSQFTERLRLSPAQRADLAVGAAAAVRRSRTIWVASGGGLRMSEFDPLGILRRLRDDDVRFVVIGGFAGNLRGSADRTQTSTSATPVTTTISSISPQALRTLHATAPVASSKTTDLPFQLDARSLRLGLVHVHHGSRGFRHPRRHLGHERLRRSRRRGDDHRAGRNIAVRAGVLGRPHPDETGQPAHQGPRSISSTSRCPPRGHRSVRAAERRSAAGLVTDRALRAGSGRAGSLGGTSFHQFRR